MKRNPKGGWLLYLMVHVPFIWFWKIGITSVGIGADKRAKQVDRAVIGRPIPVMVLFVPGAYHIEQDLHRRFQFCHCVWYRGDGHQEWFILFPIILFPIMVCVWMSYLFLFDLIFGTQIFSFIVNILLTLYCILT